MPYIFPLKHICFREHPGIKQALRTGSERNALQTYWSCVWADALVETCN